MSLKQSDARIARIRELNDSFRRTFIGGRVMLTQGVDTLDDDLKAEVLNTVQQYDRFDQDNDPYAEHDFGNLQIGDQRLFFKIDYYSADMRFGSEDPANPIQTNRVLTIMLAEEY